MNRELNKEYALSLVNKGILIKPDSCPNYGKNKITNKFSKWKLQNYVSDLCGINVKKIYQLE